MSLDIHRRAEDLMAEADMALARGEPGEARDLYRAAALAESEAHDRVPRDRARTRGVIAVSSVALFRKAGDLTEAARMAHVYLADRDIHEATRGILEDLLQDVRADEIERQAGRVLGRDWFEWRLTGASIGTGTAPLPLVAQKIEQIQKYATRVYEYLAHVPLRIQGPVDEAVKQGMELVISQPAAGSFRFSLRLSMPEQMTLFGDGNLALGQISETFFRVLEAAVAGDTAEINQAVPEADYQAAFLHLVRNLIPDGRSLTQIEVRRQGTDEAATTVLRPTHRAPIDRAIRAHRPPHDGRQAEHVRVDTLRAIHLNQGWIVLGREGHERRCYVGESMVLEDVVEGLVNRRVRVVGHWVRSKFVIDDIAEANPDEPNL
jgi:hypothetical protein